MSRTTHRSRRRAAPSDSTRPASNGDAQHRSEPATGGASPVVPAKVHLRVRRQDGPERVETRRWEDFELEATAGMTVTDALAAIAERPLTRAGAWVTPVAWDADCSDIDCGACLMLVNGHARAACQTLVANLTHRDRPLVLEPLSKFPLVRDLVVDRSRSSEQLRQLAVWLEEPSPASSPPPQRDPERERSRLALARCTSCGACLEVCPQYGPHSDYVGAAAINRVRFSLEHATSELSRRRRVEALMVGGGIADCGQAEACVEACPQGIPLVDSLQSLARATSLELWRGWLLG